MEIDKATSNLLNNMKHQRNILKARETKASLIALRKQWLDRQENNYQSEYNRILGLLQDSVLKGRPKRILETDINT